MKLIGFTEEAIKGQGEDSGLSLMNGNAAAIAVFDGCGGSGSRTYPEFNNESGAKISSFTCSCALQDWFEHPDNGIREFGFQGVPHARIAQSLKQALDEFLRARGEKVVSSSGLKGKLYIDFPTTMATALLEKGASSTRCILIWAGDSRIYYFSNKGLRLLTSDDTEGGMDETTMNPDGTMSQVIALDSRYTLHSAEFILREPCIIFSATDGVFSYYPSPMDFETMLLETLFASSSADEWISLLSSSIGKVASDDYSLQMACVGYSSFGSLVKSFSDYRRLFKSKVALPLSRCREADDREGIISIWNRYRSRYFELLRRV
ncbi:MAG: protein phosphatase 2C domain-containing protein [Clostridia bacterium]|nr:protein phosphatase 2C domain-containing protein [Clostridia bacterium]